MTNSDKPILRKPASPSSSPSTSSKSSPSKSVSGPGGKQGGGGHKGGASSPGGHSGKPPSCWLNPDNEPSPDKTASFVEYLRWMRELGLSPTQNGKDPTDPTTKVQILQMAMENAKYYDDRLKICNKRTRAIAKDSFEVTCPWRIRVGGHRGPESILLPAFDAFGMPYIPSATLRGVARNQAIREVMKKTGKDWKSAERDPLIVKHFGSLEADKQEQAGKVVFFDAYPTSGQCLAMDMANNIWSWDGNSPKYSPNPNPFLSLKEPTFLIGLGLISGCQDQSLLEQVKKWLMAGLANGAGSQVNTGYGQLLEKSNKPLIEPFLEVKFALEGQLIHSYQKSGKWNQQKGRFDNGVNHPEVRSTAFKSMLRYWFRVFALGVLSPSIVKTWEGKIFGSINPELHQGYLRINLSDVKMLDSQKKATSIEPWRRNKVSASQEPVNYDRMEGNLIFTFSSECPNNYEESLKKLIGSLTWLMFHLGGVGQGARRPKYNRSSNPNIRGCTFDNKLLENSFSKLPATSKEMADLLETKIQDFYNYLKVITNLKSFTPKTVQPVSDHDWAEAIDTQCKILVVSGAKNGNKPYALDIIHSQFHELDSKCKKLKSESKKYKENNQLSLAEEKKNQAGILSSKIKSLCGGTDKDFVSINGVNQKREAIPSPVWIRDFGNFQVVTIFGATASPRKDYLNSLKGKIQVFP